MRIMRKVFSLFFSTVYTIGTFLSNQKMHSKKCVNMLANSSLDSTQTSVNQKLYFPHILDPARSPDSLFLFLCSDTTGSIQKNTQEYLANHEHFHHRISNHLPRTLHLVLLPQLMGLGSCPALFSYYLFCLDLC